jgi:magnesium-transporting ATPase (P-type)
LSESNLDNTRSNLKKNITIRQYTDKKVKEVKEISAKAKADLRKTIENFKQFKDNAVICMTGKTLEYIMKNYRAECQRHTKIEKGKKIDVIDNDENSTIFRDMAKLIYEYGKIFSRMQPNNKVELVNFFKEYNEKNIVAMCGDGANDCGALLSADIGISISHKKSTNITAHFYSEDDSISCIEIILKNGRACLENSVIISKFMIIYGILQNSSMLYLFGSGSSDYTHYQYLFLDCFTVLLNCLFGSK